MKPIWLSDLHFEFLNGSEARAFITGGLRRSPMPSSSPATFPMLSRVLGDLRRRIATFQRGFGPVGG